MPVTRPPTRFLVNGKCHDGCSVGPSRTGEAAYSLIHADIEQGYGDAEVERRALARGVQVSDSSINRHRKLHLSKVDDKPLRQDYAALTELEALEAAIQQGQKNIENWNMTPSEWMKALELKHRLTDGNVFDAFLGAVASASQEVADGFSESESVRPQDVDALTDPA